MQQKILSPHRPPHCFPENGIYFITASAYHKKPLFDSNEKKAMLESVIAEKAAAFGVKIFAFAIMNSHYHILAQAKEHENLPDFIKGANGKSAFLLNAMDGAEKRKVWYNYWDFCIRKEEDFWSRFNYIHHNPVKHGYVADMGDHKFSSYGEWIEKKGAEWMNDVLEKYPVIDFTKGDE